MFRKALQAARKHWHKLYFCLSLLLIIFVYGTVVGHYQVFPYNSMRTMKNAAQDWFLENNWRHYAGIRPEKSIRQARHEGSGVTIHDPRQAQPGCTFLCSLWDGVHGMNLVGMDGSLVHRWRVSFNEIWPEAPHLETRPKDWDAEIHGALLFPNGDVVFNFEEFGLVRIDKHSQLIWKLPYRTHHSLYQDAQGNLWTCGLKSLVERQERLPGLNPRAKEEFILKVSPGGEILREISILDVLYRSGREALLFANGDPLTVKETLWERDYTHLNDVEILEADCAARYPLFEAGDVLVSLRNLNALLVIDPQTEQVKWSMVGPWIRQHDPDFREDGHISVFDNRKDEAGGSLFGGSRILAMDPVTREFRTVYEGGDGDPFFTNIMGKHQYLENGNILVVESEAGRAFEVTPAGEIVWTYVHRYDEDEVLVLSEALRYPDRFAEFTKEPERFHGD